MPFFLRNNVNVEPLIMITVWPWKWSSIGSVSVSDLVSTPQSLGMLWSWSWLGLGLGGLDYNTKGTCNNNPQHTTLHNTTLNIQYIHAHITKTIVFVCKAIIKQCFEFYVGLFKGKEGQNTKIMVFVHSHCAIQLLKCILNAVLNIFIVHNTSFHKTINLIKILNHLGSINDVKIWSMSDVEWTSTPTIFEPYFNLVQTSCRRQNWTSRRRPKKTS